VARKAPRKAPRQVVAVPVEDTITDVIEEPAPGVVLVTESVVSQRSRLGGR
jgi:hypothetical protein